jgi:hypothetical protein
MAGSTQYFVTGEAPKFSASVEVDNSPYGSLPTELFCQIATDWAGWKGEKGWQALEGEYVLSASTDSTGHITIAAWLNGLSHPPTWEGKISVVVEAGALDKLANEAKEFFGPLRLGSGA